MPACLQLGSTCTPYVRQMMTVASMLSPESSVFLGGKGPEQLAAGTEQQGGLGRRVWHVAAVRCMLPGTSSSPHQLAITAAARRMPGCCPVCATQCSTALQPRPRHTRSASASPDPRRSAGRARRRRRALHQRPRAPAAEGAAEGGAGGPHPAAQAVRGGFGVAVEDGCSFVAAGARTTAFC